MPASPRIPRSGPATVKVPNGTLKLWYDREWRVWMLGEFDADDNQIFWPGSNNETSTHHDRSEAVDEMRELIAARMKDAVLPTKAKEPEEPFTLRLKGYRKDDREPLSPAMSHLRKLTDDARALAEPAQAKPLSLLTLSRNDIPGALAVATSLKAQGRLDSGRLQMLVQLQDDATGLEAALAGLLGDDQ